MREITDPISRNDLRGFVRKADEALQKLALAEANAGRSKCRFATRHNEKVELMERLRRLFPGCAIYLDPAFATNTYGTIYIVVDWS